MDKEGGILKSCSDKTFIYCLNDPRTGLMRYIGKADDTQARFSLHISRKNTPDHRGAWIRSLLTGGLRPELQILMEVPKLKWQDLERRFISSFRAVGMDLTNIAEGGQGSMCNREHSWETRAKMSVARKGKIFSSEHRANISSAQVGKKLSLEHRAKLSAAHKGKIFSSKHRANISAAGKGRKHSAETLAKLSAANKGRKLSSEHRAKLSAARKRYWASKIY